MPVWNLGVIAFEKVLVDAEALVERPHCAFKAPGDVVPFSVIEALGIHAWDAKNNTQVAALSEERALVDKPEQADQRTHAAGFEKLFGDLPDSDHGSLRTTSTPIRSRFVGSYWVRMRDELRR